MAVKSQENIMGCKRWSW